MSGGEQRAGVDLTNLDQPLSPDAGATKRDLVDYLDAVAGRMLPGLVDRPLTVMRVLRGQSPFMQKNAPKYTPDWVKTVPIWAEASKREIRYPVCDDLRTLLWLANQRAVEYHRHQLLAREHRREERPQPVLIQIRELYRQLRRRIPQGIIPRHLKAPARLAIF